MSSSFEWIWPCWERTRLRVLSSSQESVIRTRLSCRLYEPLGEDQWFVHRLVLLFWIGEIELAKRLWNEEKSHFFGDSLEDFLFRVVIRKDVHRGLAHPEFGLVRYYGMSEEFAFLMSTAPLSDLLKRARQEGYSRDWYSSRFVDFLSLDGFVKVHGFSKKELERVAIIVPQEYHEKVRLPLILLTSMDEVRYMYELDTRIYKYRGKYKVVGSSLENFLLQKLLKLTSTRFERYAKAESIRTVNSISMLKRRKFYTIYAIFPEAPSGVWLSTTYENPSLRNNTDEKGDLKDV